MDNILQKALWALLTSPAILLMAGFVTWWFPPKEINPIYGFRMKLAMKSQENWNYANKLGAKLLIIMGVISFLLNSIMYLIILKSPLDKRHTIYNIIMPASVAILFILLASVFIILNVKLKMKDS